MGWGMSWGIALLREERHRFDAGDFKGFAATGICAAHFIVEQDEVALGLGELSAIPFVAPWREPVPFFPEQVA